MPLITCPDCLKQISDRVEACPFCGCPARFFSSLTENKDSSISTSPIIENTEVSTLVTKESNHVEVEEYITFSFGTSQIKYPKSTEKIAKLYGKYVTYSNLYYAKYYDLYASAGSMYSVLNDLTQMVIEDIKLIVEEACKDLYSLGIRITSSNFIEKYEIDFQDEIDSLYEQYDGIQQEGKKISYQREVEKANRGHWQGGGFGMKGAIKGAVDAAVLNAGSGLIHSIGDGITKSSDTRYLNNKMNDIYKSQKNRKDYAKNVYNCIDYILDGIKEEMSDANIIDIDIFGSYDEIESNYETTIKYEKSKEKLLDGMVKCFACVPEIYRYYKPVINELFELNTDIEAFLSFWGLSSLFEVLEQRYEEIMIEDIENPFVRNVSDIGIQIQESPIECDMGVLITGKIIKGRVHVGDSITLLKDGFCAGISTVISSIREENEECSSAKFGKIYQFILPIKHVALFDRGMFLVDSTSFDKTEADLYARYYQNGEKIIWGFDDYCLENGDDVLVWFDSKDKYTSCRGVDFTFDASRVMEVYGETDERSFDDDNDVTLKCAMKYNWLSVLNALDVAVFSISYALGEEYFIRFYFDRDKRMLLVVYMNDVDTSNELDSQDEEVIASNIQLQIECQKCGKILNSNTKFCNFCGEPNPLFLKECPECGKMIKNDAKFCNFCGIQFE